MSEGKSRLCVSCRKSIDEFIGTHTGRAGWQVKATREGWTKPEQTKGMLYEALSMSSKGYGWTEIIDKLVPETQQEKEGD